VDLLGFVAVVSGLMTLEAIALVVAAGSQPRPLFGLSFLELLAVSMLAGVLGPIYLSDDPRRLRTSFGLFLLSVAGLGTLLLVLEPDSATVVALALNLTDQPYDLVTTHRFLRTLPHVVAVVPLMWSVARSWRRGRAGSRASIVL
jgi:hypothetical protein